MNTLLNRRTILMTAALGAGTTLLQACGGGDDEPQRNIVEIAQSNPDLSILVEAVVAAHEADDLTRLDFAGGSILVARRPEAIGHRLRCRIHARDVSLALDKPQASSILNVFRATVSAIAATDTPGQVLVQLYVGATPLLARITGRSRRVLDLQVGCEVWAQVKAVALLG